jgi:uncharacterized tellurite resistance protein B-like protein
MSLFQAPPEDSRTDRELERLKQQFRQNRATDWSVPEAFLCLLVSAAMADGNLAAEEQMEIHALARRSRALKSVSPNLLATTNASVNKRLATRPNALREACDTLPTDMRLPVFAHCVDIVLADGALLPVEADFLNRIMGFLAIDEADGMRIMQVMLAKNLY